MSKWNRNWLILIIVATLWSWLNGVGGHVHGAVPASVAVTAGPELWGFTASWCPPCQEMKPILARLEAAGYRIRVVDCSDRATFENAKAAHGFRSLPMFIIFDGGREIARRSGKASAAELAAMLVKPKTPNALLIDEGKRLAVNSLRTGQQHPILQAMAERHAAYQARVGVQGHQLWDDRQAELERTAPECRLTVEVAAESNAGQGTNAAAAEMYQSWRQSPGHWAAVNGACNQWGYAMAYSPTTRKWYAAGVLGHASYRVDANGFRVPAQRVARMQAPNNSARSRNFVVSVSGNANAQQIATEAERFRRELAIEWLGVELPAWSQPCPIHAQANVSLGAGGATSFHFENRQVFGWKMQLQGSCERIVDSVLPHEIIHTLFASYFREPVPRWADEGAATTAEHASEISKHKHHLVEFLRTGRGIPFNQMLAMTEYPADVAPLYAQGYSLVDFLIEHNGKQGFVGFLEDAIPGGNYAAALRTNFDYGSTDELQTAWLEWIRAGSPRVKQEAYRLGSGQRPACHRWRPLKRLWERRPGFIFPKLARQQQQPSGQAGPIMADAGTQPGMNIDTYTPDPPLYPVSGEPTPQLGPVDEAAPADLGGRDTEAPPWRPGGKIVDAVKRGTGRAIDAAEGTVKTAGTSWLTGALVSWGVPGGIAAVLAGGGMWLVMRRGKKAREKITEQLQTKVRNFEQDARLRLSHVVGGDTGPSGEALTISGDPVLVERNRNHVVELDHAKTDAAWSRAHRIYMDYYPGTANALKSVEKLKNQILKGDPLDFEPRF